MDRQQILLISSYRVNVRRFEHAFAKVISNTCFYVGQLTFNAIYILLVLSLLSTYLVTL